jgi:ribosome maturation factor RimP
MITEPKIRAELFNLNVYRYVDLYRSDRLRLSVDNQGIIKIDFCCIVSKKWSYFHFSEKGVKDALDKFNSLLAIVEADK